MVLTNDEAIAKKINSAVFPGLQGGPLMHVIAAKAVAFGEALQPEFKSYIAAVVENAKVLAATLKERGADVVSGGTDTHLALIDLTPARRHRQGRRRGARARRRSPATRTASPIDPLPPIKTSGIRVGSPAGTTRGFGPAEFREIGNMVADVLDGLRKKGEQATPGRGDVATRARCARASRSTRAESSAVTSKRWKMVMGVSDVRVSGSGRASLSARNR